MAGTWHLGPGLARGIRLVHRIRPHMLALDLACRIGLACGPGPGVQGQSGTRGWT